MLKSLVKAVMPHFVLHEWHKRRFNPRLVKMGIVPRPARAPVTYLGTEYGGFAVDPAAISGDSIVYALGAGMDISFEEQLIRRTSCHVHIYDPTPKSLAWLESRFANNPLRDSISIHPLGLWSGDTRLRFYVPQNPDNVSHSLTNLQGTSEFIEVDCVSLKTAMQRNGHDHIDLLKLNVEGAEYEILNAAFDAGILPRLLLVNYDEVHTEGDDQAPVRLHTLAQRIASLGYRVEFAELARVTYSHPGTGGT